MSCMKQRMNAYYLTTRVDGSSIQLFENGKFEYINWGTCSWAKKGKGVYSIEDKYLSLYFGDYDSTYVSIVQELDSSKLLKTIITITPSTSTSDFERNCYYLSNSFKRSRGCSFIDDNVPCIITNRQINAFSNSLEPIKLTVYLSQENGRLDSLSYHISESQSDNISKSVIYSDTLNTIKPNSVWRMKINKQRISNEYGYLDFRRSKM